jgi:hypothetical protein
VSVLEAPSENEFARVLCRRNMARRYNHASSVQLDLDRQLMMMTLTRKLGVLVIDAEILTDKQRAALAEFFADQLGVE